MKARGALTLSQEEHGCAVYGMPKAARLRADRALLLVAVRRKGRLAHADLAVLARVQAGGRIHVTDQATLEPRTAG